MKKKIVSMFIAMTMVMSTLAGCGNVAGNTGVSKSTESTSSESSAEESTTEVATEEEEEPVEINWLGYYTSNLVAEEDSWAEQLLEENFNVILNSVTGVTKENMSVFISSGEIFDVTCFEPFLTSGTNTLRELYEQEVIRDFPEEWLWEYYPTGMQLYTDYVGTEFFEKGEHLVDGKCITTPYSNLVATSTNILVYRKDWMEKLGMKEPTTLDELHDLLYAFTYNDPDGNGKNDTYGIDASRRWRGLWPVLGAFGIADKTYTLEDDGSVTYSMVSDEYKKALTVIKQWYDEGIIDPSAVTDDRNTVRQKWCNGETGAMVDTQTWYYSNRGTASIIGMVESIFGENVVDVMGPLTTTYGDGTVYTSTGYPGVVDGNRSLCFTAEATDEQVIAVLKMLEGLSNNTELYTKILYGEEGVDYTVVDGAIEVAEHVNVEYQASKGIGDSWFGVAARNDEVLNMQFSSRDVANNEKSNSFKKIYQDKNFGNVANEAKNQYQSEIDKISDEFYSGVLLGNVDLEKDWNQYVQDMYNAGLDKILAGYEEALK